MGSVDYFVCDKFVFSFEVSIMGVPQVMVLRILAVHKIVLWNKLIILHDVRMQETII
jgi:hypothetical protein